MDTTLVQIDFQDFTYLNAALKPLFVPFLIGVLSDTGGINGIVFNNLGVTKGTSVRKFLMAYIIFIIAGPKYTWVVAWGLFQVGLKAFKALVTAWYGYLILYTWAVAWGLATWYG